MESKIYLLKDKCDYVKRVTNDKDIINVTGSVGSGKSTYGRKYRDNKDYIVIGIDSLIYDKDPYTINDEVLELKEILNKKYGEEKLNVNEYYDDIVKYIRSKNKKGIIEGGQLLDIDELSILKGEVIVKRTARLKCYYRSAYRDFKNPAWRVGLNKLGLIKRFFHCFKRRFRHVFRQKHIEDFINKLEKL